MGDKIVKRLVVGQTPFKTDSKIGKPYEVVEKEEYGFSVAAFIPKELNVTNASFRRVIGFIYGKKEAKNKITRNWKRKSAGYVVDCLKKDNVFLGNCSEKENLKNFLIDNEDNLKVLALGDTAIKFSKDIIKKYNLKSIELFKYTHPSMGGCSQQLFEDVDYKYNKNKKDYDSVKSILQDFTI